jgi:hypothetical protein
MSHHCDSTNRSQSTCRYDSDLTTFEPSYRFLALVYLLTKDIFLPSTPSLETVGHVGTRILLVLGECCSTLLLT